MDSAEADEFSESPASTIEFGAKAAFQLKTSLGSCRLCVCASSASQLS